MFGRYFVYPYQVPRTKFSYIYIYIPLFPISSLYIYIYMFQGGQSRPEQTTKKSAEDEAFTRRLMGNPGEPLLGNKRWVVVQLCIELKVKSLDRVNSFKWPATVIYPQFLYFSKQVVWRFAIIYRSIIYHNFHEITEELELRWVHKIFRGVKWQKVSTKVTLLYVSMHENSWDL